LKQNQFYICGFESNFVSQVFLHKPGKFKIKFFKFGAEIGINNQKTEYVHCNKNKVVGKQTFKADKR